MKNGKNKNGRIDKRKRSTYNGNSEKGKKERSVIPWIVGPVIRDGFETKKNTDQRRASGEIIRSLDNRKELWSHDKDFPYH